MFYSDRRKKDGLRSRCRSCDNRKQAEYQRSYAKTPKGQLNQWKGNLSKYGLTPATYLAIHDIQDGLCAICGKPETKIGRGGEVKRLAVDHDHQTGQVRGLLCNTCNIGVGHFLDDPALMRTAADYIEKT
jgi:hypothetical protein